VLQRLILSPPERSPDGLLSDSSGGWSSTESLGRLSNLLSAEEPGIRFLAAMLQGRPWQLPIQ
jgi:hypothetical protein